MSRSLWPQEPGPETSLIRPYSLTDGRTRPSRSDLSLAAQVVAVPAVDEPQVDTELREILAMCVRPLSVAEVAARATLPLGVTRILMSDLLDQGLLMVSEAGPTCERPSLDTLRLVLDRIRDL
ncbi:hypothetical protein GCM10007147_11040 [Nocardiopsis kunsanensis]|uniref:DUF742 domain-containing protein n=1 Tax=Nocardiopsis kunsanensis TaxID=141693 RepID=A0A918X9L2_9ACTN|nr:DUF742 domain-containing protein [Nocardiopsis kunsanensis]GHD19797.1 hypothetical protein GCM10007147_11040 [Nocardiopsis kunsanensis]